MWERLVTNAMTESAAWGRAEEFIPRSEAITAACMIAGPLFAAISAENEPTDIHMIFDL
jgi:hypothetical protein